MTNTLISFLAGISVATWLYTKFMRRSGGNTKNSLFAAGFIGLIVFFIVLTIGSAIDSSLQK